MFSLNMIYEHGLKMLHLESSSWSNNQKKIANLTESRATFILATGCCNLYGVAYIRGKIIINKFLFIFFFCLFVSIVFLLCQLPIHGRFLRKTHLHPVENRKTSQTYSNLTKLINQYIYLSLFACCEKPWSHDHT